MLFFAEKIYNRFITIPAEIPSGFFFCAAYCLYYQYAARVLRFFRKMLENYDGPMDFSSSSFKESDQPEKKKRKHSKKHYNGDSLDPSGDYKHPRSLVVVINNPTSEDKRLLRLAYKEKQFNYIIGQYEAGENGTLHIQAYVETARKLTEKQVRQYLPRASIFHRGGTTYNAESYACDPSKRHPDYPQVLELGQRDTMNLNNMQAYICMFKTDAQTMSVEELKGKYSMMWLRYTKAFWETIYESMGNRLWKEYKIKLQKKEKIREIHWICGVTGIGKSTGAIIKCSEYIEKNNLKEHPVVLRTTGGSKGSVFFEEYDCENTAIIDDIDPNWMGLDTLKALTDQMPIKVHVKGTTKWWNVKLLYITSVQHPHDLYHSAELNRRLSSVEILREPDPIAEYLPKETQPSLCVDPAKPLFDQLFKD